MGDQESEDTLRSLFRSEHSPELSDSLVDDFLASRIEGSAESGERVIILFVDKVLATFCTEPIKEVEEVPFGRWIESVRRTVRLSVSDIGIAVGKDPIQIERLESSRTWPWEWEPKEIVHLLRLFRIHMKATTYLVKKSFSLSRTYVSGDVIGRANRGRMTKDRGDSTSRALDMFLARKAKPHELDDLIQEWLSQVQKELEHCRAHELLD